MKLRELIVTVVVTTIIVYGGLRTIDKDKQIVQQTNPIVNVDNVDTVKPSGVAHIPCEPMRIINRWGDETGSTDAPEIVTACIGGQVMILSRVSGGWDLETMYKNGVMVSCDL